MGEEDTQELPVISPEIKFIDSALKEAAASWGVSEERVEMEGEGKRWVDLVFNLVVEPKEVSSQLVEMAEANASGDEDKMMEAMDELVHEYGAWRLMTDYGFKKSTLSVTDVPRKKKFGITHLVDAMFSQMIKWKKMER